MARLQEEVEMALRDEVEARVSSALSEEEVMQVTHEVWATFYSHTLQYHLVSIMPFLLPFDQKFCIKLFYTFIILTTKLLTLFC